MKGIMNIIENDYGDCIGFYSDLADCLWAEVKQATEEKDIERARDMLEQLEELLEYREYTDLLIISDNNGMGFTVRKYADKISQ